MTVIFRDRELLSKLYSVKKPASYLPLELNLRAPRFSEREVRIVLTYPDLYEVGSSHIGGKILYHVVNNLTDFALIHRAYLPRPDMQSFMEREGIPLYTIEEQRPVKDYDLWGLSFSSELTYTNALRVLELAGLRIRREEREGFPVVFAGGPCVYNPVPLAPFIDLFVIGDGEEVIVQLAELMRKLKREGGTKEDFLREAREIGGVWVPSFGKYPVKKAVFTGLGVKDYYPTSLPVPVVETAQDRIAVEAARGCLRGCRFCQAGYVYRPYRERDERLVRRLVEETFRNTGYEEASLSALSVSDHSRFNVLVPEVMEFCYREMISLSLPSMRVKGFNPELASQVMQVKKTGFTLAPEVGSDRLRRIINKDLTNEDLFKAVEGLFERGWNRLKLYFMVGLPFELWEDVDALVNMLWTVYRIGRKYRGRKHLAAGISIFVPKPFTPFQWEAFAEEGEVKEKVSYIKRRAPKAFTLRFHDYRQSLIEAILTRGDESVSRLIEVAYREGCQLDGWEEYFNWKGWQKAFEKSGIDLEKVLGRRELDEELPWDFIRGVVTKEFLLRELERAKGEEWTPDCRIVGCHACGSCTPEQIRELKEHPIPERIEFKVPPRPKREFPLKRKVALIFEKTGYAKYLSLLDLSRAFTRTFRKFGVPLRYSQGFNPHPKMNILLGLPVGVEGLGEVVEVELSEEEFDFEKFIEESEAFLPQGLRFKEYRELGLKESSLSKVREVAYRIRPYGEFTFSFLEEEVLRDRRGREVVLKEWLKGWELDGDSLRVVLNVKGGNILNIQDILFWMGLDLGTAEVVREELLKNEQADTNKRPHERS
ncbi:MAG: TIGR03960 family B12-binding radical SAM protein [Desulfurobacterium sp.]|nr:MAG: TIGR03960 family B12-binding radical SAM protein [Desulfurobacterium sp.]